LSATPRGHAHQPPWNPRRSTASQPGSSDSPPWDGMHSTGPQSGPDGAT